MTRAAIEFVRSAAGAADFTGHERPQVALAGRSNVGKSSLINALCRQRVARTSAAPGKTRLVNFYRAEVGGRPTGSRVLYLVDLPGYGFASGRRESFECLVGAYFSQAGSPIVGVLLLADARHPGLPQDRHARDWLLAQGVSMIVVGTKLDTLPRAARRGAVRELETCFNLPAVAVSTRTGEGLDLLWNHIIKLITAKP